MRIGTPPPGGACAVHREVVRLAGSPHHASHPAHSSFIAWQTLDSDSSGSGHLVALLLVHAACLHWHLRASAQHRCCACAAVGILDKLWGAEQASTAVSFSRGLGLAQGFIAI